METCAHLDCDQTATARLRSKYGRIPWLACPTHQPGMLAALQVGQPATDSEVLVTRLDAYPPGTRCRECGELESVCHDGRRGRDDFHMFRL